MEYSCVLDGKYLIYKAHGKHKEQKWEKAYDSISVHADFLAIKENIEFEYKNFNSTFQEIPIDGNPEDNKASKSSHEGHIYSKGKINSGAFFPIIEDGETYKIVSPHGYDYVTNDVVSIHIFESDEPYDACNVYYIHDQEFSMDELSIRIFLNKPNYSLIKDYIHQSNNIEAIISLKVECFQQNIDRDFRSDSHYGLIAGHYAATRITSLSISQSNAGINKYDKYIINNIKDYHLDYLDEDIEPRDFQIALNREIYKTLKSTNQRLGWIGALLFFLLVFMWSQS
ncbi:MAG TPA: hypothetical protein DGP89_02565 [Saprospirales bacterium]|nr:hypothetical protein [Saprospirales bacterium]